MKKSSQTISKMRVVRSEAGSQAARVAGMRQLDAQAGRAAPTMCETISKNIKNSLDANWSLA
ncbi:hypothetical protein [Herbaspirillum huttiense]|uniref:hypothetical protein n=1 Tax=Herbaspirillum huttiense TaxID=863372 RepID=UPI003B3BE4DB